MNGEKPNFNFGGNRQHRPMGFGQPQKIHGGQKPPEHFRSIEQILESILKELQGVNDRLDRVLQKLDRVE